MKGVFKTYTIDNYITDPKTGEQLIINTFTGEVHETFTALLPYGSIIYTPQQQEEYKRRKEIAERKRQIDEYQRVNGYNKYAFVRSSGEHLQLKPETVARLIYLSTFIKYGDNILMKTQRTPFEFSELPQLLNISKSTFKRFWKEVKDVFMVKSDNGTISINTDYFIKGKIQNLGEEYQKIYNKNLQELYKITPSNKHRYLGYVFQLLPYINTEYNIICKNPEEKELEKVKPIFAEDFCKMIGYDVSHKSRLMNEYSNITYFTKEGYNEGFCSFVTTDNSKTAIYINPNIIYKGDNLEKVLILGAFSRWTSRQI